MRTFFISYKRLFSFIIAAVICFFYWLQDYPNGPNIINYVDFLFNLIIIATIFFLFTRKIQLETASRFIMYALFQLYCFLLYELTAYFSFDFIITAYKRHQMTRPFHFPFEVINIIPFHTILSDLFISAEVTIIQIIGNLLLLMPLGFFILYFKMASQRKMIFLAFCVSMIIELTQLLQAFIASKYAWGLGRACDIDDVILNTLSAFLAIGVYKLYSILCLKIKKWMRLAKNGSLR
ncbi:MAG: VanZ family protein [Sporolactobacillus sp.]